MVGLAANGCQSAGLEIGGMARKASTPGGARKRYQQVAESLLGDIRAGRLAVGDTLPGELDLVGHFDVSRHTVREALRRLEELGLIGRRQGVGTVVLARQPTESYVQAVRSPAALLQYPAGSRLVLRSSEAVRAGRALARLLGCKTGAAWHLLCCLREFADGRPPVCWTDLYLLPEYAGIAAAVGRRSGFVYELVEDRYGQRVASIDVDIMAQAIPERMSEALGVAAGTPSLTVVRRYLDRDRRLFMVSVSEHPGDRFTYSMGLERGWQSGGGAVWSGA